MKEGSIKQRKWERRGTVKNGEAWSERWCVWVCVGAQPEIEGHGKK